MVPLIEGKGVRSSSSLINGTYDIFKYFVTVATLKIQGVPKNEPRLRKYCGGAVDSITLTFTHLHRSGFNLEFEAFYESIWYVVADYG